MSSRPKSLLSHLQKLRTDKLRKDPVTADIPPLTQPIAEPLTVKFSTTKPRKVTSTTGSKTPQKREGGSAKTSPPRRLSNVSVPQVVPVKEELQPLPPPAAVEVKPVSHDRIVQIIPKPVAGKKGLSKKKLGPPPLLLSSAPQTLVITVEPHFLEGYKSSYNPSSAAKNPVKLKKPDEPPKLKLSKEVLDKINDLLQIYEPEYKFGSGYECEVFKSTGAFYWRPPSDLDDYSTNIPEVEDFRISFPADEFLHLSVTHPKLCGPVMGCNENWTYRLPVKGTDQWRKCPHLLIRAYARRATAYLQSSNEDENFRVVNGFESHIFFHMRPWLDTRAWNPIFYDTPVGYPTFPPKEANAILRMICKSVGLSPSSDNSEMNSALVQFANTRNSRGRSLRDVVATVDDPHL